jgi:DNA-binding NtrC family response regulator
VLATGGAFHMNILLLDKEKTWIKEVQEVFQNLPITIYIADSQQQARRILANHPIKIVLFALRTLTDLEFLHYLNTSYRQIEVILTVENPVSEIVTILKEGTYRIMDAPVMPSALRTYVETVNTERRNLRR